jgi:hypothetical protein
MGRKGGGRTAIPVNDREGVGCFFINKEESAIQRVSNKSIGKVFVKLLLSRTGCFL